MIEKPADVFGRTHEWDDLVRFACDDSPGLRIGVVRGRRRHGKSFLLEHLCRAVDGTYTLALRQSRTMALNRFADSLSSALGYRIGRFDDWVHALDTAVDSLTRSEGSAPPLLVLDEFPYLSAHSPELPTAVQALYDQRGPSTGHPPFKLILCGSALSVMSTLLSGDQALRGRAVLDLKIGPFRHRDAAAFWDSEPETALLIDAVIGGAPGYRDVIGAPPRSGAFGEWLETSLLNPSHILFAEPDYLLAEDPRIGDRAVYHSIWEAVSSGAATPTQIGGLIGMDAKSLGYHLKIMRDGGFIRHDQDILLQRKPVITVADPAVRFHHLIVRPNLLDLEMRNSRLVWEHSAETFSSKILGPHFEEIAREWVRWHGREAGLEDIGQVGTTEVACREHRGHEVDVVALSRRSMARAKGAGISLLGEAKCTNRPRGVSDLARLEHIRDLLVSHGWDARDARFALFSRSGFTDDLKAAADPRSLLIDLPELYGKAS
ncbi:ATP-binding protein [Planomonospora parontospora]|nr:ATP-binding protein [Planomonospora parontospora]